MAQMPRTICLMPRIYASSAAASTKHNERRPMRGLDRLGRRACREIETMRLAGQIHCFETARLQFGDERLDVADVALEVCRHSADVAARVRVGACCSRHLHELTQP